MALRETGIDAKGFTVRSVAIGPAGAHPGARAGMGGERYDAVRRAATAPDEGPREGERMLDAAATWLRERLGREPELAVRAPGRVNLIGEHTDYNQGLVLPCAIDLELVAVGARRADGRFRVASRQVGEPAEFDAAAPTRGRGWLDYVQGVVAAFRAAGLPIVGLDLALVSSLPREAGLSSSAALELAVATALAEAAGLGLDGAARARLAHRAETDFVGVPCGRMDQLACALGRRDHALRIDCRDDTVEAIPLPGHRLGLLIAASGVRRQLASGAYARRRTECAEGLARARQAGALPGAARAWRDAGSEQLPVLQRALDPVRFRRARHVIRENQRVEETCAALRTGDLPRVGALLREGMASLRDDFEVSVPELDLLCELGDATPGCFGSRLTGAGFGGCTVHLVAPARAEAVADALRAGFARRFGREPPVWPVVAADGAAPLPLPS